MSTLQSAVQTGTPFHQSYDQEEARIANLETWVENKRQMFQFGLRRPLTTDEQRALEDACTAYVARVGAPRVEAVQVTFVESKHGLARPAATGEVFWSLNYLSNAFRSARETDGYLPAVVHNFRQMPSLKTVLGTLVNDYDPDLVRARVFEYNTLLKMLEEWQDAQKHMDLDTQKQVIDKHIQELRPQIDKLWQDIVDADQKLVEALKQKPDLAKDTSNAALQELYMNARERLQQAAERVKSKQKAVQLKPPAQSGECSCSLSDLDDSQLQKKKQQ